MEADLKKFLKTKVVINKKNIHEGQIIIDFISDNDLNRIIKKIQ